MIEQQARVLAAGNGRVRVRVGAAPDCALCASGRGCGAGLFGSLLRRRPVELDLPNDIGAEAGQVVRVGLPESAFVRLAARLYLWPLVAAVAGAIAGHGLGRVMGLGPQGLDLTAALGAIAMAALSLWAGRRTRRLTAAAELIRLLPPGEAGTCSGVQRG